MKGLGHRDYIETVAAISLLPSSYEPDRDNVASLLRASRYISGHFVSRLDGLCGPLNQATRAGSGLGSGLEARA